MSKRRTIYSVVAAAALLAPATGPSGASAQDCTRVCVTVVTTHDSDGPGPADTTTRAHRDLLANAIHFIDVDGSAGASQLPVTNVHDLAVKVEGLDANKPKITVEKMAWVDGDLPVKVEVAKQDAATGVWKTLGYDALRTPSNEVGGAPARFVADVDTSNRDGLPDTEQARVVAQITGAAASLAIFNEGFKGDPAGSRTDRTVRKATLYGNATGARVPGEITVDLSKSQQQMVLHVTRDVTTLLDYEISAPGQARVTGSLKPLENNLHLTVTSDEVVDIDGRGTMAAADKKVNYSADGPATVSFVSELGSTRTEATVVGMPPNAYLTYLSDPGRENVTYHASSRATRLTFAHRQTDVVDGKSRTRTVSGQVDNLPAHVYQLEKRTTSYEKRVHFRADGRADKLMVQRVENGVTARLTTTKLPKEIQFKHIPSTTRDSYHYDADDLGGATSFLYSVAFGTRVTVDLTSNASTLVVPKTVDVYDERLPDGRRVTYNASSALHNVVVTTGTNATNPLVDRTKTTVTLTTVPTSVVLEATSSRTVSTTSAGTTTTEDGDYMLHSPTGGRVGKAEVVIAGQYAAERLPTRHENGALLDGLLVRDLPGADHDVIHARATNLGRLRVKPHATRYTQKFPWAAPERTMVSNMRIEYDALAGANGATVDFKTQRATDAPVLIRKALLESIPRQIVLDARVSDLRKTLTYSALDRIVRRAGTPRASALQYVEQTQQGSKPPVMSQQLSLDPVPRAFTICREDAAANCAQNSFHANLIKIGRGPEHASETGVTYRCPFGCPPWEYDPNKPASGSFRVEASEFVKLFFLGAGTTLSFDTVRRWVVQGHSEPYQDGRRGYLGMDTGGAHVRGSVSSGSGSDLTRFRFGYGSHAEDFVWSGGSWDTVRGGVARVGGLDCGTEPEILLAGETYTDRFCYGHLLEESPIPG